MRHRLAVSDLAEGDLAEAIGWYQHIRPGLEADLTLCVEQALDRIREHPEAFPVVMPGVRRAVVRRFPYSIVYRVRQGRVEVEAIFHARQDPIRWQRRIT
jgi:plasmid stabilization system protein ParE